MEGDPNNGRKDTVEGGLSMWESAAWFTGSLVGAGIGAVVAGPVGGIAAAVAGGAILDKIVNTYEPKEADKEPEDENPLV
jgi:outer membrane lipoprotein SlyB